MSVELYDTPADKLRAVVEVAFAVAWLVHSLEDGQRLWRRVRSGAALPRGDPAADIGFGHVAARIMTGICIFWWGVRIVPAALRFSLPERWDVYDSLASQPRRLLLNKSQPGTQQVMLDAFDAAQALISSFTLYSVFCGANVAAMLVHVILLCDFQSRMGIITRTLSTAAVDLAHYMAIVGLIFVGSLCAP